MNIPTSADINVHDSPDERVAVEHFLGKTVEQAEALFAASSMTYQEDLMWMGPRAYAYYLPAALRYLQSDAAAGDDSFVDALVNNFEFRRSQAGFDSALQTVRAVLSYVVDHESKFEIDTDIYGDLGDKCRALHASLGA